MSSKQTQMARLQAAMRDCKDPVSFFLLSLLAKLVIALHFKKVDIRGKENLPATGPFICIANHSSRWDGPTLGRIIDRPANFMVSPNELQGLQGFLLSRVGAFPAHPKLDFVSHVMQQFKKGEPFVIFPEGNVFYDGHTHPFKKGIARIAFAAQQNNIDSLFTGGAKEIIRAAPIDANGVAIGVTRTEEFIPMSAERFDRIRLAKDAFLKTSFTTAEGGDKFVKLLATDKIVVKMGLKVKKGL